MPDAAPSASRHLATSKLTEMAASQQDLLGLLATQAADNSASTAQREGELLERLAEQYADRYTFRESAGKEDALVVPLLHAILSNRRASTPNTACVL